MLDIFQRFMPVTEELNKYIGDEAKRLKHSFWGPEHLLLGLIAQGELKEIFESAGITLEDARKKVEERLGTDLYFADAHSTIFTNESILIIEKALQIALDTRLWSISPEHILLSILEDGKNPAASILRDYNVNFDNMKLELEKNFNVIRCSFCGMTNKNKSIIKATEKGDIFICSDCISALKKKPQKTFSITSVLLVVMMILFIILLVLGVAALQIKLGCGGLNI